MAEDGPSDPERQMVVAQPPIRSHYAPTVHILFYLGCGFAILGLYGVVRGLPIFQDSWDESVISAGLNVVALSLGCFATSHGLRLLTEIRDSLRRR